MNSLTAKFRKGVVLSEFSSAAECVLHRDGVFFIEEVFIFVKEAFTIEEVSMMFPIEEKMRYLSVKKVSP